MLTCYGGKREPRETSRECLERELDEELGWRPPRLPSDPACALVVNGLLVAHFYVASAAGATRDDFTLEPGRSCEYCPRDDPRWSPWHAAVLDALQRGANVAHFDDGDRPGTLALLRGLPTRDEPPTSHALEAADAPERPT